MIKQFQNLILKIGLVALLLIVPNQASFSGQVKTAIFAGGCFWCVEADFDKLPGVTSTISGYSGGFTKAPTYKTVTYQRTGHYEVVKVSYNPAKVTYRQLVDYFLLHIDPLDPKGQFCDKGPSYRSAIFPQGPAETKAAKQAVAALKGKYKFNRPIATKILPRAKFYTAETYHQNYYKKNPSGYNSYRWGCGRDKRIKQLYGK